MTTALISNIFFSTKDSLHNSVANGKFYHVQKLIMNGNDPNKPHAISGQRPIHIAASRGHLRLVQYLFEKTACEMDAVDKEGETALLKAAYAGHFSIVKYLVEKAKVNYLHQDRDGWTALHNACSCGNISLVEFLLNQPDIDVDVMSQQGHTPLMNAASKGFVNIVTCLLEKNHANPTIKNNFNETAYDVAAASGEAYLCQLLEQYEVKHVQDQNYDPLEFHVTIPVILIEQAVDMETEWYFNDLLIENKSKVKLPNHSWFWLSDWMVDYSFPDANNGWYLCDNQRVKRRRWIRIMKKVMDSMMIYHEDSDVMDTSSSEVEEIAKLVDHHTQHKGLESKTSTSVSTTMTKAESVFIGCSTLPQPLLQEQIIMNQSEEPVQETPASWERNDQAIHCRRCDKAFSFLIRRHHCRKCGQIVCDRCSTNRALLPYSQIIQPPHIPAENLYLVSLQPQRICDHCVDTLVYENSRTTSVMLECPVCGKHLVDLTTFEQEQHVQDCLNKGPNGNHGVKYVVYKLAAHSTLIGQECIICFEEFKTDDTVTRLNCMCSYHGHCISGWFSKGKDCPVHSQ